MKSEDMWVVHFLDGIKYGDEPTALDGCDISPLQSRRRLSLPNAPFTICHLCSKPVELEKAKTDEHGRAVHEQCYLRKVRSRTELPDST
jgi:hypothetical protein